MNKKYTVYTDQSEYRDVCAVSAKDAERIVYERTMGRATNIYAVAQ